MWWSSRMSYDNIRAGLATWFRRIIDPDTATWQ
jgi:hypothetical protein